MIISNRTFRAFVLFVILACILLKGADWFPDYRPVFAVVMVIIAAIGAIYCAHRDCEDEEAHQKRLAELEKFWDEHHERT